MELKPVTEPVVIKYFAETRDTSNDNCYNCEYSRGGVACEHQTICEVKSLWKPIGFSCYPDLPGR